MLHSISIHIVVVDTEVVLFVLEIRVLEYNMIIWTKPLLSHLSMVLNGKMDDGDDDERKLDLLRMRQLLFCESEKMGLERNNNNNSSTL